MIEELEDTFTSSTLMIPRTTSTTLNEENSLSDISYSSEGEDKFHISSKPSINKSQSLSILPESRIRRMKSLKKSKSFGAIYDSSTSHSYHDDDSISSSLLMKKNNKSENSKDKNNDESDNDSPNSLKRSISSLSYFSEDNKTEKKNDQSIFLIKILNILIYNEYNVFKF